jgi:hypothetical protein
MLPLLLIVFGLGCAAVGFVYYRRVLESRELAHEITVMSRRALDELGPDSFAVARAAASGPVRHVRIAGPDVDETYEVRDKPLTIGAGSECQIRLSEGVAAQHARLWLREGVLMLHDLAVANRSRPGGNTVWASLDYGDEVKLGQYRLRVED